MLVGVNGPAAHVSCHKPLSRKEHRPGAIDYAYYAISGLDVEEDRDVIDYLPK